MVKGAVLIGCGFVPAKSDIYGAIWQGCLKNCQAVSAVGFEAPVQIETALTLYVQIAREQGWDEPTGLQARQFTTSAGRRGWSIWPVA